MRSLSKLLAIAIVAALAVPTMASAATHGTRGVVVQRDVRGGAVVIATNSGALQRVKVTKPSNLKMGTVVRVLGAKLSVVGHSHKAKLHGIVVRRNKHSFALAGNGSVLAVASTSPPAAGQSVTTEVQVDPTELSDNDGECHVDHGQADSTTFRGAVLSVDATTLRLTFPGFPSGLPIAIGTVKLPVIAVNTPVVVRVTLGPDPANPTTGIVLTLVSLRLDDDQQGDHGDQLGANVKADGAVTQVSEAGAATTGSITIDGEHGSVTFIIPAGFAPTGVMIGDEVEAWGTPGAAATDQPTLVRLESAAGNGGQGDGGHHSGNGGSGDSGGSGGSGNDD